MNQVFSSPEHARRTATTLLAAAALFALVPFTAFAAGVIEDEETVANVAASTIPAITFEGGAAATNATSTLTAVTKANLANGDYFIISDSALAADAVCFYFDVDNTLANDGGTAAACQAADGVVGGVEVSVSADTTAIEVAGRIHTAITAQVATLLVTSTNNGDGTLLLTADTAGTAGNIALNANYMTEAVTNAGFTLTALTGGAAAVAATDTIVIPAGIVAAAADQSITIDGVVIALGATAKTAAEVAEVIADTVLTGGTVFDVTPYDIVDTGASLTITKNTTGTGGNGALTIADASYGAKAQVVTFTPTGVSGNESFKVTINGNQYNVRGATTVQEAVEGLVADMAEDADVTCIEDNVKVTCTADVPGTAFTFGAATTGSSSGGGGGGGSSGNNNDDDEDEDEDSSNTDMDAEIEKLLAQVKALQAQMQAGTTNGIGAGVSAFARDLDMGATGSDVMALQAYLNAKGFMVAETGPGSKGMETEMFGGLTQAALAKFQASVGISPAVGYFGPKTRAYVAANP